MNFSFRPIPMLLVCAGWLTLSSPAMAQIDGYPCNGSPGERQVGVAPPLGTPICVRDAAPKSEQQPAQPDSTTLKADAILKAGKARAQGLDLLLKDPEFQKLSTGYWSYLEPGKDGASSTAPCVATFTHISGLTSLIATGGPDEPLLAKFLGADIPRPKTQRATKITYASDKQPAGATVSAMNISEPQSEFGALAFGAGNNLEQAMTGMFESEEMTLKMDGKTVFSGLYRGGNAMKKRFSQCVKSRPR